MDKEQMNASQKDLTISEGDGKNLMSSDVTRDHHPDNHARSRNSRSDPSSESGDESGDAEKDDPANALGPISPEEVSAPSTGSQSPQIQIMGQFPSYDPNRIPSSIFTSKPTTPTEWSVASNESLFSIYLGNNSFSKDHVLMLYKSGELPRFDEMCNMPPIPTTVVEEENAQKKGGEDTWKVWEKEMGNMKRMEADTTAESKMTIADKSAEGVQTPPLENVSQDFRISTSSTCSFQFPVFGTDLGSNSPTKVLVQNRLQEEKQHLQPRTPRTTTPRAAVKNWFSCFSCGHCLFSPQS